MSFGSTFLHSPDLCPVRRSGETWGDEEFTVSLAGEVVSFVGLNLEQRDALTRRCTRWLLQLNPEKPELELRVFRIEKEAFKVFDTKGWEYVIEMEFARDVVRCVGLDFVGVIEWREGHLSGGIWTFRDGTDDATGAFANFLRLVAAYRMLERGGLLLHSAGVHRLGKAVIGYGRSGAGKTTFTHLCTSAGFGVISDDLVSLHPVDDGVEVRALPFSGELEPDDHGREPMPLKYLCRLSKGEAEYLRNMDLAEAVASLLACSPAVNNDPYRRVAAQRVIEDIVTRVKPQALVFRREGRPWTILER